MDNGKLIKFYEFNHKQKKNNKIYIILSCLIVIFLFISAYLFYLSGKPLIIDTLKYKTTGVVNYSTYYGEEEVDYNTYVRNYLSSIILDFDYKEEFSKNIKGKMLYQVDAYWFAYNTGYKNEKIYISDYENLIPLSEKNFTDKNKINTHATCKVDYKKYLQKYLSYKNSSKVSSQALLVIEYKTNSKVGYNNLKNVNYDNTIKLEIPLSENTFKISKTTTTTGKYKTVNKIDKNSNSNKVKFLFGILFAIFSIIGFVILIILYIKEYRSESLYTKSLKKILNSYDNVIVDVEELPDIENKNVINVKTFDELLDAQMQIGMPINFKEDYGKSIFILVQNDMAWIYVIKKD